MTFGNSLNEYYISELRKIYEKRIDKIKRIRSADAAENYIISIRCKLSKIFNLPFRPTHLNAKVTSVEEFKHYTLEKLYYFSRPYLPVTANLYIPKIREPHAPAVLLLCGHAIEGKASKTYQSMAVELTGKGFIVLIIDPIEQGERLHFKDVDNPRGGLCPNHNMLGKMLALNGEWLGSWFTYDAIRGLDYLESRPEVDPERLFVTGNSGGGTITTWVAAVDDRPIAVAPSCFVTSWLNDIENELPSDIEQIPPGAISSGLDISDFLLTTKKRHTLILGQKNDFFDPRGLKQAAADNTAIASRLNNPPTEYFIGPGNHGLSKENRNEITTLFVSVALPLEAPAHTDEIELPPLESTLVTTSGNVLSIPKAKNIRTLIIEKTATFHKLRKPKTLQQLQHLIKTLLNLDPPALPHYRVLRTIAENGYFLSRFGLETEKGCVMALLLGKEKEQVFNIDVDGKNVTLLIPNLDGRKELANHPLKEGEALYALDIRGIGELMPSGTDQPTIRDFFAPYQSDYHYASVSLMLSKPIIGGKIKDIISAVKLLKEKGAKAIHLKGNGLGAIPALFATLLSDEITTLELTEAIFSYEEELATSKTTLPLSYIVPGILKHTDLPEIRSALKERIIVM